MLALIKKHQAFVEDLKHLIAEYPRATELEPFHVDLDKTPTKISVFAIHAALCGEVFGTSGWTKKKAYATNYNWEHQFGNLLISIYNAETIDFPDSVPVVPKEFPLLLADISDSSEPPSPPSPPRGRFIR